MRAFLNRLLGRSQAFPGAAPVRQRGRPPSGNGASSMHLFWDAVPAAAAVRATVEVTVPPRTTDLYFFALQASFAADGTATGGGHIGLQWNSRHPNNTAANWGGYGSQAHGGAVLDGTESALASLPDDPNTRDYSWLPNRKYRLTIEPGSSPGWWRGVVTDMTTDRIVPIRELNGGGDHLQSPMVWAEVFAACDGPSVTVEWSDLEYLTQPGGWLPVDAVTVNYQDYNAGGCTNTDSVKVSGGVAQTTNTTRSTPNRSRLTLRHS